MTARLNRLLIIVVLLSLSCAPSQAAGRKFKTAARPAKFGGRVNAFIGTGGIYYLSGFNNPGATVAFGAVRLSPDTWSKSEERALNTSGYYYDDRRILGFSHTRLLGTGAVDGGHFSVMPHIGPSDAAVRQRGLDAYFNHDKERAFPGYYAVQFPDNDILAELTATTHVGLHRYTFPEETQPHILIDVTNALGKGRAEEGDVRILPDSHEVEGSVRTFGSFSGRYGGIKAYFVARFDRPFTSTATWSGDTFAEGKTSASGNKIGVELGFDESNRSPIGLKLAISYVSLANARENLKAEVGNDSFDTVLEKTKQAWEQKLTKIRVKGGTRKQQIMFYSALYHSFQMPTEFNDVNGQYFGFDKQVHKTEGFKYYTDMSLWDTFRTTHPLYALIDPAAQRDMVISLIKMAEQGGYLPRWPSGNGYTNSMFGTPADAVVAETYLKGIRNFDAEAAYQFMRKAALEPTPKESNFSGREGVEHYVKYGYCPSELMHEAVARTLEFGCSDNAIAGLAEALGHKEDAKLFRKHAQNYRNQWNPETQYFQPRKADGTFVKEFKPLLMTYVDAGRKYTDDYVEGSALQWRWAVPYDAPGLVSLFKSKEYFVNELDYFFQRSIPQVSAIPNSYYWQGNQPDIHAVYLFNSAGRPDLTQKWVRWILDKKHGIGADGIDGNDDGGTLSAWFVFSSLGLYPIAGTDVYELGAPLWKEAEVSIGDQTLKIVADNYALKNIYVNKVWLNGKELNRTNIRHSEIAPGGELKFEMSEVPSR